MIVDAFTKNGEIISILIWIMAKEKKTLRRISNITHHAREVG